MNTKEKGNIAEQLAVDYLVKEGYQIFERNWYYQHKEIDIISIKNNVLVFVEVKSKENNEYGEPYESVGRRKQKLLIDAADAFVNLKNFNYECRFDVISIYRKNEKFILKHFKDAFQPEF